MIQKVLQPMQRLARWFFGAPFRQLPPEFGETVPPDLQAFEANAEAAQLQPRGSVQPSSSSGSKQAKFHH
jgi:hypothetical protein